MLTFVFLALGIAVSVVFIIFRKPQPTPAVVLLKVLSGLFFIATALSASTVCGSDIYSTLFIAAAVFGLLGDVWLDFKWIYTSDVRYFMTAGFIFFICGHLCFSAAIMIYYRFTLFNVLYCLGTAAVYCILVQVLKKPLGLDITGYNVVATAYMGAIAVPVAATMEAVWLSSFSPAALISMAGMFAFLLSDLVLSGTYFGRGKNTRPLVVLNHSLYYIAQFAMALSIYFIK